MNLTYGARAVLATALHHTGILGTQRHLLLRDRALILLYHRVLRPEEVPPDVDHGIYVTTSTFETHLRFLSRTFDVVDLDDLLAWREGRRRFSKPPCAITFDDGWIDNYTNAFPLLRRYGMSATIFLITSQIGSADFVTWDHVREMEGAGIRFGSHTVNHPVVLGLSSDELEVELSESKRQLLERTTRPSCWFCYPKGYNNEAARQAARRHYCGAVTTRSATVRRDDDLFGTPRVSIHDDVARTTALFAFRLTAW